MFRKLSTRSTKRFRAAASAVVVVALAFSSLALSQTAAQAAPGDGAVSTEKYVQDPRSSFVESVTGVQPGETFGYTIVVRCFDAGCINAKTVDPLPLAWNGLRLSSVSVDRAAGESNTTIAGCTVGSIIAASAGAPCEITVRYLQDLDDDTTTPNIGLHDGNTFNIIVNLTVPTTLPPSWPGNHNSYVNTATTTADNSVPDADTASARIDIPTTANVDATKSWTSGSLNYNPGGANAFTLGVTNTSNVDATSIELLDAPGATAGAANLTTTNPFYYVDFDGLGAGVLPEGADQVQVDLYYRSGGTYNWVTGTPAATPTLPTIASYDAVNVGGVRITYTNSVSGAHIVANGVAGSQVVKVVQREKNRAGVSLASGTTTVANTAVATVSVPTLAPVTDSAAASFTITPVSVKVIAGVTIAETQIPAGTEFDVTYTGKNDSGGPLSTLTLTSPDASTHPFMGSTIEYVDAALGTWPTGAVTAEFRWTYDDATIGAVQPLTAGDPIAAPTGGHFATGYTITYFGPLNPDNIPTATIVNGTTAGVVLTVRPDHDILTTGSQPYTSWLKVDGVINVISAGDPTPTVVTGTDSASDSITVFAPSLSIDVDKTISPAVVSPGATVVATLTATTDTSGLEVKPTTITVDDYWGGSANTFWDAFRLRTIAGVSFPASATADVYLTTSTGATPSWALLASNVTAGYSASLATLGGTAVANTITGVRFVFKATTTFAQGTNVRPVLTFEAAATKRSGGATSVANASQSSYVNTVASVAVGRATGASTDITSPTVTDTASVGIKSYAGTGAGNIIVDKSWSNPSLFTQTGAGDASTLTWGVTTPGFASVTITDPATDENDPSATAFRAFDLNKIRASSDALFEWDSVTLVELYNSTSSAWETVTPPAGGWMDGSRHFVGHDLTSAETARTTGVRITVAETANDSTRRGASSAFTTPAAGSGVVPTGTGRQLTLDWVLRDKPRGSTGWVTASVVPNTVLVSAPGYSQTDSASVTLTDDVPNVGTEKTPATATVVAPFPGDVLPANYPTQNFMITTWNESQSRASYLRSMDPLVCATEAACVTAASSHSANVFAGKSYDPATSPFEKFTIIDIDIAIPSDMGATADDSTVAFWHFDGTVTTESVTDATDPAIVTPAYLADVVGISVVYQSADPDNTGARIVTNKKATLTIKTRLRPTERSNAAVDVVGGETITNTTFAQAFAPNTSTLTPNDGDDSVITLSSGQLKVGATKTATPSTILESAPTTPTTITLVGNDNGSTVSPEKLTITDTTVEFWDRFALQSYDPTSVALPLGSDRVHVEVQVNDDPTWIAGTTVASNPALPASVTDLSTVTGIRFIFETSDGLPFDDGIIPAGYTATAKFVAVLRAGASFPSTVTDTVSVTATHAGFTPATATSDAVISLGSGNFSLAVQKDNDVSSSDHKVAPGATLGWTLKFTNNGTGYLNVDKLVDTLDPSLEWDGDLPTITTTSASLTTDASLITVTSTASTISFQWPSTQNRLEPGKSVTLKFKNIALAPLSTGQTWNGFVVTTTQTLDSCLNTSGNGQGITTPATGTVECGTRNYVESQVGPLVYTQKYVNGDVEATPLVDGATNVKRASLTCVPRAGGFFRTNCVANTAVGKTDVWRLYTVNTGTIPYDQLTIIDPLPIPGDRLLATGNPRNSTWRPVVDLSSLVPSSVTAPAGTGITWQVTTTASPCFGTGTTSSFPSDETCASAATWTDATAYTGTAAAVTGLRVLLDFTTVTGATPGVMAHNDEVTIDYKTINTPLATSTAVVTSPTTATQYAWNQSGAIAHLTSGIQLSVTPAPAGVSIVTGPLEVAKAITGDATSLAPASVKFDVTCRVAGTPIDLGSYAVLTVAVGGSTIVPNLPLGATCTVAEQGALGAFNETARTGAQTVDILAAASGSITPASQRVSFTNTYTATPSVQLVKTSAFAPGGSLRAGDGVIYTFAATNTGNVPITKLTIIDTMPGLSDPVFSNWPSTVGVLAPGETVVTTATYTMTQADVDRGSITNRATIIATPPSGPDISGFSISTLPIAPHPAIELVKTGVLKKGDTGIVGDTVEYTFVATNTGNVTLTDLAIVDAKPGLSKISYEKWPENEFTLSPGESVTAHATYTLTATDVRTGDVKNAASVSGTGLVQGVSTQVSAQSAVTVQLPSLLAATGMNVLLPGSAAALLILGGGSLLLIGRRRAARHRA